MDFIMQYILQHPIVETSCAVVGALAVAWVIWYLWETAPKKRVHIAIGDKIDPHFRHGNVWVKAAAGGLVKKSFIVEEPGLLVKPHYSQIADIFWQVAKLNMSPDRLEITIGGKTLIYKYGERKPVVLSH